MRNNNQDPKTYSQERRQYDTLSWSARTLVRGDDSQIEKTRLEFHNMQVSDKRYLEKVFRNQRQKLNLAEEAPVLHLKTDVLIWGLFMSTVMTASVYLGPNYIEHLEVYRNTNFEELKNLFDVAQRLTLDHEAEILYVPPIDWTAPSWTRFALTHDQAVKWTNAKSTRLLDSVFCLGKIQEHSEANQRWKDQLEEFRQSDSYTVEWNTILPGLEILQKIQKDLQDRNIEPGNYEGRSVFVSMFNDIDCTMTGNSRVGRKFPIGNAYSYTVKRDYPYLCMWMTSNWLERNKTLIRCGKYSITKSIWENQHLSLIMYTWDALKDNVK